MKRHPTEYLLLILASMIVHAVEFMQSEAASHDKMAFDALLASPEVQNALKQLDKRALLPVMRSGTWKRP